MECGKCSVACEEEWLGANKRAESSPGRASDAAKQAACRLLGRLKCPAFSALELHNGFPNTLKARHSAARPQPHLMQVAKWQTAKQFSLSTCLIYDMYMLQTHMRAASQVTI
jgi:hypothetical protein